METSQPGFAGMFAEGAERCEHSYPERPNRCTGVRVLALDTGLGRVPGTGGHLVGSVDEEKGSAGPQLTVQTCVCVRVCLCTHMCGAYARVWYVDACTCV